MRARGRFDIVAVFEDGAYLRFTSDKTRSVSAAEMVDRLREYANYIERGVKAEQKAKNAKTARHQIP
jgi:hypothetical protein